MCDCAPSRWHYLPEDQRASLLIRDNHSESTLRIANKDGKTFCVYHVDGRLLTEETGLKSCDFLLVVESEKRAVLIELKGKNVSKGLKQLWDSLGRLSECLRLCKTVSARLVSTEVRFYTRSPLYSQLDRLLRSKNGTLELSKMPLVL